MSAVLDGFLRGAKRPPRLTVAQWADENRYLPPDLPGSGRWSTADWPFQREPMDCITDLSVEVIVLKWASQVGKSEVLNNTIGYFADADPARVMMIQPDLEGAERYSEERIGPLIDYSPALRSKVGSVKTRDASEQKRKKTYPGGFLVLTGANSPASLASRPVKVVLYDEIDKYKAAIGKDGDPIKQGFQRTVNYWDARKLLASTPTIKGMSAIDGWYEKSDQRLYMVPCPHCGEYQFMHWERETKDGKKEFAVKWQEGKPETADYVCAHCGGLWSQADIRRIVKKGVWQAQKPFNGIAGFHINALYSPHQTMADLVKEYEEVRDSPEEYQTFVNLKLGECFEPAEKPNTTPQELMARAEDFGSDDLPLRVLLLTLGVDVQADRLEAQLVGWGTGDESWTLDHYIFPGDPLTREPWDQLDELLARRFTHPRGKELVVEAAAVDSQYLTDTVMQYCAEHQAIGRKVYAIKGMAGEGVPIWRQSQQSFKAGKKLYLVGIHDAKMKTYRSVAMREPGPNFIHFSSQLQASFYEQLLVEEIVTVKSGPNYKQVFQNPKKRRNEALDCRVYAMGARFSFNVDYAKRLRLLMAGRTRKKLDPAAVARMF